MSWSHINGNQTTEERFWAKVEKSGNCWIWIAASDRYGYGHFAYDGKVIGAHRASYLMFQGSIPAGLQIDHLCRNRLCVRPDHLELVTQTENQRRGRWAQATHCVNGHAFNVTNTYLRPNGRRDCRSCITARQRRSKARRLAA